MNTLSESTTGRVDFQALYVEDNPDRASHFRRTFGDLVTIETVASRTEATLQLQQGKFVDLVIINDALGGLKFLHGIDSIRTQQEFSAILLIANAAVDTNVQAKGQPVINIFSFDFDETDLRKRLAYLILKKDYKRVSHEISTAKRPGIPAGKRLFDVAISLTILVAMSPLLLIVGALIRFDSKGSVFYVSKRVSRGYRLFDIYKFRTMRTGADALITGMASQNMYNPALPQPAADAVCERCQLAGTPCQRPLFDDGVQVCEARIQQIRKAKATFMKFREDPRVTKLGKFLRNTSIDELPQLINILKGDMSVVGNRPLPAYEAERLTSIAYARRFTAPVGLTGLWQVTKRGKANVSDQERIQLDVLYAKNYSFKTDLIILIRTVKAVFQRENA